MAETLGQAVLELVTDDSALGAGINRAQKQAEALGKRFQQIGDRVKKTGQALSVGLTAPILGIGAASAKTALDFEHSLSMIVGLVGVNREEVDGWRGDLERIGRDTGKSLNELAEGLFFVTSAGARGSQAIDILEQSAKAAAAGLGETMTVADAVTSAINAYGAENLSAAQATGILVATVREGKTAPDELAGALGRVLPLASQLGVNFDQVGASIAAMTRLGLNASESASALRGVFAALVKPSSDAEKALADLGLTSGALREQIREQGLLTVLLSLRDSIGDNQEAMARIFPDVEGLTGVLNLVGANAENTRTIFASLAAETGQTLNSAFAAVADDGSFKLQQSQAQLSQSLAALGSAILPVLLPLIGQLTELLRQATEWFSQLDPATQETIVQVAGLAAAIGPVLVVLGSLVAGLGAIIPVLTAVGGAILALIAATGPIGLFILAATAISAAWAVWGEDVNRIVMETITAIRTWLVDRFDAIVASVKEKIDAVTGFFAGMYDAVVGNSYVPDMIDGIMDEFGRLGDVMTRPAEDSTGAVSDAFGIMQREGRSALDSLISDLKRGEFSWERLADVAVNALQRMVEAWAESQTQMASGGGFDFWDTIIGYGGDFLTGIFGGGGTPYKGTGTPGSGGANFATGGSFIVRGPGGTDSQQRLLNLTPGERVDVMTPSQQRQALTSGKAEVSVTLKVENKTDTQASAQAQQRGEGSVDVMVLLEERMARRVREGGPLADSILGLTGARRAPTARA